MGKITYLVLVLIERLQDILGAQGIFALARTKRNDGVFNLFGREDGIVQLGMGVYGVLFNQLEFSSHRIPVLSASYSPQHPLSHYVKCRTHIFDRLTQSLGKLPFSITILHLFPVGL
jgi:hypothetical protein